MINSKTIEYYHTSYVSNYNPFLCEYLANRSKLDRRLNIAIIVYLIAVLIIAITLSRPIFAYESPPPEKKIITKQERIYLQKNFEENIKNKYNKSHITFPTKGIAHIKTTKYINKKPIKVNIVEINTTINKNLKIKPQTASSKLNSKKTVKRIAQQQGAIIAINGGYFKPQTGVPLGALMIDRNVLTGPIFNRVGIAIFENGNDISFKMDKINFEIKAYTKKDFVLVDNINQPRMLSTYTLLYTPQWGKASPVAPKNCYNMLIVDNKIEKISANPIEFVENGVVLQAPKKVISKLAKNNKEVYIDIKLQDNLKHARHIIGAGPYLVKDSEVFVDITEQKFQAIAGRNPRSAIGFKNDGTLIIATIDGREKTSVGMTLTELAKFMKSIGCDYAMNFDGGSSSALYVKGKTVNSAINKEGIAVSNALLISEIYDNELQLSSL
ncbi:MAG: phosphodiester glycosidase family protein [Candidatus Gastranaerophilales bacterium]|nr:phosphodiester glycosidase family protein [Candidatus Gastranaerophilales bacterium]